MYCNVENKSIGGFSALFKLTVLLLLAFVWHTARRLGIYSAKHHTVRRSILWHILKRLAVLSQSIARSRTAMADVRRERRRSDRSRPSRSRSPRNQRMRSRSPRKNSPPSRNFQGKPREREIRERKPDEVKPAPLKIDREKTCPLLLRVFCNQGRHNRLDEYTRQSIPKDELQIYTWKDATLKELMNLVKEVNPKARKKGTYFDFATIFPEPRRGSFVMKEIGTTCSGMKSADDSVTLAEKKFQIGDYLDISIATPRERRDVF